jgi:indolepyruvate ferredoxin oxidoreductase
MFSNKKDALGRPAKKSYDGRRMMPVFRLLARMKGLRGTAFDVFGYSAERRLERDLIASYEKDVALVLDRLSPANVDSTIELLSLPDRIRGYGPVKEKAVADAKLRYGELVRNLADPPPAPRQIAAE